MRLFYVWRGVDEWRAESCTVELNDEGLSARGVQIGREHRLHYELTTDARPGHQSPGGTGRNRGR